MVNDLAEALGVGYFEDPAAWLIPLLRYNEELELLFLGARGRQRCVNLPLMRMAC